MRAPSKTCPICGERQHSSRALCTNHACQYRFYVPRPPANKGKPRKGSNGTKNGQARLTEEKVRAIRRELRPFINTAKIAAKYGISKRAALSVYHRESWAWLD